MFYRGAGFPAGTVCSQRVSSGWMPLSDPGAGCSSAGCGEATGETGLGLAESGEELLMLSCPLKPALVSVVAFPRTCLWG